MPSRRGKYFPVAAALVLAACGGGGGELDPAPGGGGPDGNPGDAPPTVSVGVGFAIAESAAWEGTGGWPIVLTASEPATAAITITVSLAGGTATAADAGLPIVAATLAAGEKTAQLVVPIVDDVLAEAPETLQLAIAVQGGKLAADRASHTLTILDNDARVWPGATTVAVADAANRLGANLSGLTYEAAAGAQPARMWAVKNGPSLLYRLEKTGALWAPSTSDGWSNGKTLRFPGGAGSPDAEGVTRAGAGSALYVAIERDNDGGASRPGVLRYDPSGAATTLDATHAWDLTGDLPTVDANAGFEAITWIPDALLVARGFRDDKLGKPYAPADYPGHGEGLFVLGLEGNGMIYVYALHHRPGATAGAFTRIASFASGHAAVMALEQDGALLWAGCDNTCDGALTIFTIDDNPSSPTRGRFVLRRRLDRPTGLANLNNEGIALAPDAECANKRKPFFWTDDGAEGGNALRQGSVACGAF